MAVVEPASMTQRDTALFTAPWAVVGKHRSEAMNSEVITEAKEMLDPPPVVLAPPGWLAMSPCCVPHRGRRVLFAEDLRRAMFDWAAPKPFGIVQPDRPV